jgi:hypothetical protein
MGIGNITPPFLTSALDGGEWSASRRGRLIPVERSLGAYWKGGLGVSQSRSGRCGVEKNVLPRRESKPGHSVRSPSIH